MNFEEVARFKHSSLISNRVWCCSWKFNGSTILSAGEDKTVKVWSFDRDKRTVVLGTQIAGDNIRTIRSACFSPNGQYLATASFDGSVIVYGFDEDSFEERHKLEGHENEVKCVGFSPSGQYLATSSRDKTVFVWQFDEDEDVEVDAILQQHSGDVKFVTWHPQEDTLVSGGYDCSLIFYKFDGDEWISQQKIQAAHEDTVWNAQFDSSGTYLVSVGGDSKIKVWKKISVGTDENTKWNCVITLEPPNSKWPIYTVSWDHYSNRFAAGGGDRFLWMYELDKLTDTVTLSISQKFPSDINCAAFNPALPGLLSLAFDCGDVVIAQIS